MIEKKNGTKKITKPDQLDFLVAELKHKQKVRDALKEKLYGKDSKQSG